MRDTRFPMNKDSEREHQAKLSLEAYLANASNRDDKESLLKKIKFNAIEICELMNIPLIPIENISNNLNGLDGEEGGVALREEGCRGDFEEKSLERIDRVVEDVQEIDHVVIYENRAGTLEMKGTFKSNRDPKPEEMVQKNEKVAGSKAKGLPEKNHSLIIEHYLKHIASDLSRPKLSHQLSNQDDIPFVIDRKPDPDLVFKNDVMPFPKSPLSGKPQNNEADVEETIMEEVCVPSLQPSVLPINNKKQSLSTRKEMKTQLDQKNEKKDKEKSTEKSREKKSEISIDFLPDTHRDIVPDQNPETLARLKTHESFLEQFISLWDLSISLDSSLEWRNLLENMPESKMNSNWVPVKKEEMNVLIRKRSEITQDELNALESIKKSKLKMK